MMDEMTTVLEPSAMSDFVETDYCHVTHPMSDKAALI